MSLRGAAAGAATRARVDFDLVHTQGAWLFRVRTPNGRRWLAAHMPAAADAEQGFSCPPRFLALTLELFRRADLAWEVC